MRTESCAAPRMSRCLSFLALKAVALRAAPSWAATYVSLPLWPRSRVLHMAYACTHRHPQTPPEHVCLLSQASSRLSNLLGSSVFNPVFVSLNGQCEQ